MKNARQILDSSISEQALEDAVVNIAHLFGWQVAGFRPGRVTRRGQETYETPVKYDGKGFVDLILVRRRDHRPGRIIFVELKSEIGRPSLEQIEWGETLLKAGAEVYCWRPSDWSSGEIERVLL